MRSRSGAFNVASYEELLEEVSFTQMKFRDQSTLSSTFDKFAQLRLEEQEVELLDAVKPMTATARVLMLGEAKAGKTSIVGRFVDRNFAENYQPSNG